MQYYEKKFPFFFFTFLMNYFSQSYVKLLASLLDEIFASIIQKI